MFRAVVGVSDDVCLGREHFNHEQRRCVIFLASNSIRIRVFQLGESSHFISCLGVRNRQSQFIHPTQRHHLLPRRLVHHLLACICISALILCRRYVEQKSLSFARSKTYLAQVYPAANASGQQLLKPVTVQRLKHGSLTFCVPCSDQTYSLSPSSTGATSYAVGSGAAWCLRCPYGADCTGLQPRALQFYWGYPNVTAAAASSTVLSSFFVLPPAGYGCFPYCSSYNSCNGNRHGPLCGQCLPGYSRSLLSTGCVEDKECGSAGSAAFVVVAVLLIFMYCIYLLAPRSIESATNSEAYFQLIMFFYQVSTSIISVGLGAGGVASAASQLLSTIFNASPTNGNTSIAFCVLRGIGEGAVYACQAVIFVVFVSIMLAMSLPWGWRLFQKVFYASISFLVHAGVPLPYDKRRLPPPPSWFRRQRLLPAKDKGSDHARTGRWAPEDVSGGLDQRGAAWMRLYITLYSGVFSLLVKAVTCVTIEGIGDTPELDYLWYYDASVVCFAPWQKACVAGLLITLMLPVAIGLRMQHATSKRRTSPLNRFEQSAILYYMRPFKPHCMHWVRDLLALSCTFCLF